MWLHSPLYCNLPLGTGASFAFFLQWFITLRLTFKAHDDFRLGYPSPPPQPCFPASVQTAGKMLSLVLDREQITLPPGSTPARKKRRNLHTKQMGTVPLSNQAHLSRAVLGIGTVNTEWVAPGQLCWASATQKTSAQSHSGRQVPFLGSKSQL